MRLRELAVIAGFVMSFAGCGGGNGGGGSDTVQTANVNVSVNWAARSKAVNAPSSALSLVITLKKANPTTGDFSFTINRDAAPAAYTKKYTSGNQAKQGTWELAARFFSQPDGAGSVVGAIDATINLDKHGDGIGNFTTAGKIATVEIAPNQTVGVGQSIDLVVTAKDASGAAIALTAGSVFLQAAGGSGLTINGGQQVTGQAVGTAMVTATVDGITSAPQTVTVGFVPAVKVTPDTATTLINGSLHLSATVDSTPDQKVIWSVQEGASGGAIDQNGIYVAPGAAGTYHVVASSHFNTSRTATATVTVGSAVPGPSGIYIADSGNHRIVRMDDMTGKNWTAIGKLGSGTYQFESPGGLYVATNGAIYVADTQNHRIVRMDDITGKNWQTVGSSGSGTRQFNSPNSVAVDATGRIYVADRANARIVRIDNISGSGWTAFGVYGIGVGKFRNPTDVQLDAAGKIFVSDTFNGTTARIDDFNGANWVDSPPSLFHFSIDASGQIYGASPNGYIRLVDSFPNSHTINLAGVGSGDFQLQNPGSVRIGPGNLLFIADSASGRIVRVDDITGSNWKWIGSYGSGILQFNNPLDVYAR